MTKRLKAGDLIRLTADMGQGFRESSQRYRRVIVRKGSICEITHVHPASESYRLRVLRFYKGGREWRPTAVTTYVAFAGTGAHRMNQWEEVNPLDMLSVIADDDKPRKRAKK
jgi:hypothetical protein